MENKIKIKNKQSLPSSTLTVMSRDEPYLLLLWVYYNCIHSLHFLYWSRSYQHLLLDLLSPQPNLRLGQLLPLCLSRICQYVCSWYLNSCLSSSSQSFFFSSNLPLMSVQIYYSLVLLLNTSRIVLCFYQLPPNHFIHSYFKFFHQRLFFVFTFFCCSSKLLYKLLLCFVSLFYLL